jgi:hypothetical protein
VLSCQIPNDLERRNLLYRLVNPAKNWRTIESILQLVIEGKGNLKKLNFLFFPETCLPFENLTQALDLLDQMRSNTVTVMGLGPIDLATYRDLLQSFAEDNREALQSVLEDIDSSDIESLPVNSCLVAVKEQDGRMRVFFEAKSHPFVGEENLDSDHNLYRGKIFSLFRCNPSCFNFMALICLDYAYRDLYQSNISVIIEKANQLFFETRQRLDLLAVIQCNPKPEHSAFRDVANGFYGEYLERTPGVNDTVTLFCNASRETECTGCHAGSSFGHSSVLLNKNHKIEQIDMVEYSTDNFGGLPLCRLRFGAETRLFYFNLPFFHELDPRTTRTAIKIHSVFQPNQDGWVRISSDEVQREAAAIQRVNTPIYSGNVRSIEGRAGAGNK